MLRGNYSDSGFTTSIFLHKIPLGRIQMLTEVEFSFIQEMTQRSNNNVGYCYTLVYYLNIEHNQYYLTNYDQVLCT